MEHEHIEILIDKAREGTYFTIPFIVPDNVQKLTLRYSYRRYSENQIEVPAGIFLSRVETTIIDIGLIDPTGKQAGASGRDKTEITISEREATPGYQPNVIIPGRWEIIAGAYRVPQEGVKVDYEIDYTFKQLTLFRGDLHVHTLGSDGVHSAEELAVKAIRNGLDFLAITDHNQMVTKDALPSISGLTLIPGVEWTHYQGHAGFLGVDKPYDEPFFTSTPVETHSRFQSAHQRGALITINHPFQEPCPFKIDLEKIPYDCLEVWNGPMRESNFKALGLWQQFLQTGKKIPITGGSDYHRDTPFIFMGGPTMCVYAMSPGISDILAAIRCGHGFITFAPNGPGIHLSSGGVIMGDSVRWERGLALRVEASGLNKGDILRVITKSKNEIICQAPSDGDALLDFPIESAGFARVEIHRSFLPGLPPLPALVSNPIYFDAPEGVF